MNRPGGSEESAPLVRSMQKFAKRDVTPLVVITLFLSLTEAVLGAITWGLSGNLQFYFAIFFMVITAVIIILFFAMLWFRNYKLFPPRDFETVDPLKYVAAMHLSGGLVQATETGIAQQIGSALASSEARQLLITRIQGMDDDSTLPERVDRALGELADVAIDKLLLTVDATVMLGDASLIWPLVYEPAMPVFELLNNIWSKCQPQLTLFSYGATWILVDRNSGQSFGEMGTLWALRNHKPFDDRSISSVGIQSGMQLQLVSLPRE